MMWLLTPEPQETCPPAAVVEDLLICADYLAADDRIAWLKAKLEISVEVIQQTAEQTTGQRDNPLWCVMRKLRITASNFRAILMAKTEKYL